MAPMAEWLPWFGSAVASAIFLWSMVQNHVPDTLRLFLTTRAAKIAANFNPYHEITISEYGAKRFQRSEFFLAVEAYVSDACARHAWRLKAELGKDSKNLQIAVDDHEEVTDDFSGTTLWWYASKQQSKANVISIYPSQDEKRFYRVVFHRRHRELVVGFYLPFILSKGRAVTVKNRQRRLFTNNAGGSWNPYRAKSV
uniref:AAA-type ATPase N-terminal domain-containing protein n=1 Tax=Triticum urartu TaxID=4572 RepID=A0A8R7Q9G6_TRIUA